jgi:hypothetical protein
MVHSKKELNTEGAECTADTEKKDDEGTREYGRRIPK